MIRVAVVDDDSLIRESLKLILDMDDDFKVCWTCENGRKALELCGVDKPDVVLMDIRMPICDGITATGNIKNQYTDIKIIILTTFRDDEYIIEALKYGAHGYLLKNTRSNVIKDQIRLVYDGTMLIHPEIAEKMASFLRTGKKDILKNYGLSDREREIVELISDGLSNKEICEKLFLGESTVKNYISSVLNKLDLRDRTQIAVFYLKNYSD